MIATLTSKAQITLPKGVRELLNLEPGDKVDFVPQADGRITITKASRVGKGSFSALRGLLPKPARAFSVKEMNQAIQDAASATLPKAKPKRR